MISSFVSAMATALYHSITGLFDGGGGGGGLLGSIGGVFGFATGGSAKKVPSGFPSDSFPARLTSGELIVDQSTSDRLAEFLGTKNNANSSGSFDEILSYLKQPIVVDASVELDKNTFANIILNLNRTNRRLV
jgi:hypothetical protein